MDIILAKVYTLLKNAFLRRRNKKYKEKYNLLHSVTIGDVRIEGNVSIGANSYINSGFLQTGLNSRIVIGEWCAIGYNVSIISVTHNIDKPTGPVKDRPIDERDIIIGDNVWIGSNVFINIGVNVGDNTIIGANSVVVKDVPNNAIVGGVPAKLIRFKDV